MGGSRNVVLQRDAANTLDRALKQPINAKENRKKGTQKEDSVEISWTRNEKEKLG